MIGYKKKRALERQSLSEVKLISLNKGHCWSSMLDARSSSALETDMILSWESLHELRNTSRNTVHRPIHKCRLKLCHVKSKTMWNSFLVEESECRTDLPAVQTFFQLRIFDAFWNPNMTKKSQDCWAARILYHTWKGQRSSPSGPTTGLLSSQRKKWGCYTVVNMTLSLIFAATKFKMSSKMSLFQHLISFLCSTVSEILV